MKPVLKLRMIDKILNSIRVFDFTSTKLFDGNGNFITTHKSSYLIDCILTLMHKQYTVEELHIELYKCSIYIGRPQLVNVLNFLKKEKIIRMNN